MRNLLYIGNKLSIHGNTSTSIERLGKHLEIEGYNVLYASSKKNKILRMMDMIFTTVKHSRKIHYVLIDTYSTQNFWYAFIISQLCRVLNLKYITKLHGGNLPYRLKNNPKLCDLIFNNAYKVSAPSKYLFEAFEKRYSKNLVYIPNTIDIKDYKFKNRTIETPKLLWVRSFSKIYNPKMAIDALSIVKKHYPNCELCMVGPDKENIIGELKKYANGLNVQVTFTGKLSKEEWVKLSENYSIFINTTNFDNTPVSLLEAMSLGLPVITTNVGGIPYIINDKIDGILVNKNDPEAMAKEIINLMENPKIKTTIVNNARTKIEQFDWSIVKHKWFEILK